MVSLDCDTEQRSTRIIPATDGATGTLADPLNNPAAPHVTNFMVQNGSNHKLRWNNLGLKISMVMTDDANSAACVPATVSPPWNLVGYLIRDISISINGGNQNILNVQSGMLGNALTARLMRFFSKEKLNSMSDMLFTPLPDESDIYRSASAAGVALAGTALLRYNKWCGTLSHLRVITKTIPFSVLLGLPDAIWHNLQRFEINIHWEPDMDLLETGDTGNLGAVRVIGCSLVTDSYIMSPQSATTSVVEKVGGASDVFPWVTYDCSSVPWTPGSTISMTASKNLQEVMLFSSAYGIVNGQAGADARTLSSLGQFVMQGGANGAGLCLTTADHAVATATDARVSSFQIEYGTVLFPSVPLGTTAVTNAQTTLDLNDLYRHYSIACRKFALKEMTCGIDFGTFCGTMPFACLRPWSDNAAHGTQEGRQLLINIGTGTACTWIVAQLKLNYMKILSDGTLSICQ